MHSLDKRTNFYTVLIYAGALPFVLAATSMLMGYYEFPYLGSISMAITSYGLLIAAFIAGSHWGLYKLSSAKQLPNFFISSNLIALVAISGFLLLPSAYFLFVLIGLFIWLLLLEKDFYRVGVISFHYLKIRIIVSSVVIVSLFLCAVVVL